MREKWILFPYAPPATRQFIWSAFSHRAAREQPRGLLLRRGRLSVLSSLAEVAFGQASLLCSRLCADDQPRAPVADPGTSAGDLQVGAGVGTALRSVRQSVLQA